MKKVYRPVGHSGPIYVPGVGTFEEGATLEIGEDMWESMTPATRGHFVDEVSGEGGTIPSAKAVGKAV